MWRSSSTSNTRCKFISKYGSAVRVEDFPVSGRSPSIASDRTDVFGAARLFSRYQSHFAITMGLGYGLGSFSAPVPQHVIVISTGIAVRGGRFWFSLETEVLFRVVVTGSRTARVIGAITFEHDLLG